MTSHISSIFYAASETKQIEIHLAWTLQSQSMLNNTSTISWRLYETAVGMSYIGFFDENYVVNIGGEEIKGSSGVSIDDGETRELAKGEVTLPHEADGNLVIDFYFGVSRKNQIGGAGNTSAMGTSILPQIIIRPAEITSAPDFTDMDSPTINYTNPFGSEASNLLVWIAFESISDGILKKPVPVNSSSYTFNLSEDERNTLRSRITKGGSRTCRFYIQVVAGNNNYIKYVTKTFSLVDYLPTLSPTLADINPITLALTGNNQVFIRDFSNVKFTTGAVVRKGATLVSQAILNGDNVAANVFEGTFNNVNNGVFQFSVLDSRENTVTVSETRQVIPYVKLTSSMTTTNMSATGEIEVTLQGKFYSGSFGAKSNTLDISFVLTPDGEDSITGYLGVVYPEPEQSVVDTYKLSTTVDGSNYTCKFTISNLDHEKTYNLAVYIIDELTPSISPITVTKVLATVPIFDWGRDDFNFNCPISIQSTPVVDFVIEQGDSGYWFYRKWISGIVELWGWSEALYQQPYLLGVYERFPIALYTWISGLVTQHTYFGNQVKGLATNAKLEVKPNGDNGCNIWVHSPNSTFVSGDKAAVSVYILGRWK